MQKNADAEEERPIHQAVADDVERSSRERARLEQRERGDERSYVADGGERQQALEVSLRAAEQGTDDGRQRAESEEQGAQARVVRAEVSREYRPVGARQRGHARF